MGFFFYFIFFGGGGGGHCIPPRTPVLVQE